MPGELTDTYAAALQHDIADVPPGVHLAGVVRRPTRWFHPAVDENYPALGPPPELLDEFRATAEQLEAGGMDGAEAHETAWREVDYDRRYRRHLDESADAADAMDALLDRLRAGEDVALVCYENTDEKRCHRTALREVLLDRLDGGE